MAKILIFEDNTQLAEEWRQLLETQNHRVWCCNTVSAALTLVGDIAPDIIILDMFIQKEGEYIPEGGLTLLSKLYLTLEITARTIGVSGVRPGKYNQLTPLEIAKRNDYIKCALYKPVSHAQLLDAVNQLL